MRDQRLVLLEQIAKKKCVLSQSTEFGIDLTDVSRMSPEKKENCAWGAQRSDA